MRARFSGGGAGSVQVVRPPEIVTQQECDATRRALPAREQPQTHARDELAAADPAGDDGCPSWPKFAGG
jgi:hypothetical protein